MHFISQDGETEFHKELAELLLATAKKKGILNEYIHMQDNFNKATALELAKYFKCDKIVEVLQKYMKMV